jgi:glucose 1-dehydrogenase
MSRLEGKVAVVTGSGSGIGQAIAERLAHEGANLVVDYRDHVDQAQTTVNKIQAAGGKAVMVHADVSKIADCDNLIEQAWQQLGSCDILVNNAGIEKNATSSMSPRRTLTPSWPSISRGHSSSLSPS